MRRTLVGVAALLLVLGAGMLFWYTYRAAVHGDGSIEVIMCPACAQAFVREIEGGGSIECALYDVGNSTGAVLARMQAHVITDDETNAAYGTPYRHAGLMHNKYCVINDSVVLTGSYNPTDGGERNTNNLVIIHSAQLAQNYHRAFDMLAHPGLRKPVYHTIWINGTRVDNYFCPADDCEEHVVHVLSSAKEEVLFMTYSFTSDPIGKLLLEKRREGVHIEGICESQQMDKYSECFALNASVWDAPALLHHKVFIIDRKIVVTGSYNPTSSGTRRNDENVLVIYDARIAQQYIEEYTIHQQGLYTGSEK